MGEFPTMLVRLALIPLVLLAALAGCTATERRAIGRAIDVQGPVLLLGDSILVGARDAGGLSDGLTDDGWVPETVAEESRTALWAMEQLGLRSTVPSTVVVVLGSNPGSDATTFPDEIAALLEALTERGAERVVWIPPYHTDGRYVDKTAALLAAEDGVLEIAVGWHSLAAGNPLWFSGDGLHMTGEGYQGLAAYIRSVLAGETI